MTFRPTYFQHFRQLLFQLRRLEACQLIPAIRNTNGTNHEGFYVSSLRARPVTGATLAYNLRHPFPQIKMQEVVDRKIQHRIATKVDYLSGLDGHLIVPMQQAQLT